MLSKLRTKSNYRKDIQGLRAFAILSVLIFHTNKEWLPGGFIGVDIFLVISGFLITSIIINQQQTGSFSLKHFFLSRAKRIIPAYLLMLGIVTVFMAIFLTPTDYKFFIDSLNPSLYFASNYYFSNFGNYFAPNANELPLLHTWSLGIEMQFYLILPFFLTLVPPKYLISTVTLLFLILTIYTNYAVFMDDNAQGMYFSLLARIPEFLVGSWLALASIGKNWTFIKSNFLSAFGLFLVTSSIIFIDENTAFPSFMVLPACLGIGLIIAAKRSIINALFSQPLLVWIGGLSYSLYLWHWPILAGIRYYFGTYKLGFITTIFFLCLTLLSSYTSYRFIELGFLSKPQGLKRLYKFIILLLFTFLVTQTAETLNKAVVNPMPTNFTRYAPHNEICHGKIIGDCVRGNNNKEPSILFIGDSHAAQMNLFIDAISSNLSFKVVTASSCVTIPGFNTERLSKKAKQRCIDQIDVIKGLLPNYEKVIIAGKWDYHAKSEKFLDVFDNFLDDAQTKNLSIFVIAQIPMLTSNPVRLHRFNELNLPTRTSLNISWKGSNEIIRKITKKYSRVTFIDFSDSAFFQHVPFHKNKLIYQDTHHLNEFGSKKYGQFIGRKFINLINAN